jgi:hypothetical protein
VPNMCKNSTVHGERILIRYFVGGQMIEGANNAVTFQVKIAIRHKKGSL